jgi:hypothetical protein
MSLDNLDNKSPVLFSSKNPISELRIALYTSTLRFLAIRSLIKVNATYLIKINSPDPIRITKNYKQYIGIFPKSSDSKNLGLFNSLMTRPEK